MLYRLELADYGTIHMKNNNNNKGLYIDLFSGCGGFSLGLGNAGWTGLFAVEKDPMAFETFKHNLIDGKYAHFNWPEWLPQKQTTIQTLLKNHSENLNNLKGKVDLIAGGPPCQGFSLAGLRDHTDPRNKLSNEYIKVVKLVKPKFIVLENVRGFNAKFNGKKGLAGKVSHAQIVKGKLEKLGYKIYTDYIKLEEYGVPQERTRLLMVGIRKDINIGGLNPFDELKLQRKKFLDMKNLPNRPITTKEAIGDLEVTAKGIKLVRHSGPTTNEFKKIHYAPPKDKSLYLQMIRKGLNGSQPNSMRLARHKSLTLKHFKNIRRIARPGVVLNKKEKEILGIKKQAICVLDSNRPSKTITTLPDDLLHYKENRILTVRENARIQSFPDDFEFKGKYTTGGSMRKKECPRYTQVGNAVPPLMGEVIGFLIRSISNK